VLQFLTKATGSTQADMCTFNSWTDSLFWLVYVNNDVTKCGQFNKLAKENLIFMELMKQPAEIHSCVAWN
jgi:hypothetical protein